MVNKKLIILFGAPGSGKGYLGDCIKEELINNGADDFLYISTGDLLRAEIKAQTELGKKIEKFVVSGKLVPDKLLSQLVVSAINQDNHIKILDGYPRTSRQLLDIVSVKTAYKHEIISIKRDTDTKLIKERVSKRRVCKDCKATHTADDGCCPKCGGVSEVRKDDAVIDVRLAEYKQKTEHLWEGLMCLSSVTLVVDGAKEAKEVAKDFVKLLVE